MCLGESWGLFFFSSSDPIGRVYFCLRMNAVCIPRWMHFGQNVSSKKNNNVID